MIVRWLRWFLRNWPLTVLLSFVVAWQIGVPVLLVLGK